MPFRRFFPHVCSHKIFLIWDLNIMNHQVLVTIKSTMFFMTKSANTWNLNPLLWESNAPCFMVNSYVFYVRKLNNQPTFWSTYYLGMVLCFFLPMVILGDGWFLGLPQYMVIDPPRSPIKNTGRLWQGRLRDRSISSVALPRSLAKTSKDIGQLIPWGAVEAIGNIMNKN